MRRLLLFFTCLIITSSSWAQVAAIQNSVQPASTQKVDTLLPKPIGYTSDYEAIFTSSQVSQLDSTIETFEKQTGITIAL